MKVMFIHSFNQNVLSNCCVPNLVLQVGNIKELLVCHIKKDKALKSCNHAGMEAKW